MRSDRNSGQPARFGPLKDRERQHARAVIERPPVVPDQDRPAKVPQAWFRHQKAAAGRLSGFPRRAASGSTQSASAIYPLMHLQDYPDMEWRLHDL